MNRSYLISKTGGAELLMNQVPVNLNLIPNKMGKIGTSVSPARGRGRRPESRDHMAMGTTHGDGARLGDDGKAA